MTTDVADPGGYGRIISDGDAIIEIREEIDATLKNEKLRKSIPEFVSFLGIFYIFTGNRRREQER